MDPFLGEILLFAGNFAPRGWAYCEGQLLPISQYSALFSILGTTYGGDGRTTFALPDLRGRAPISPGNGPGLSSYRLGQKGGAESHTLTIANLPSHNHTVTTTMDADPGTTSTPGPGLVPAEASEDIYGPGTSAVSTDHVSTLAGGNQAVSNMPPFLALNYIIALQGTFPSRS